LVQLSPDLDLTWTYFDLSNASTINYTQTQLSATIQFNRISSVLDGSFVASNPTVSINGVTNAGKVALFKNFIETDVVYGDVNTT
jgi:50S ribosomal subunit-associated GTPase HflX